VVAAAGASVDDPLRVDDSVKLPELVSARVSGPKYPVVGNPCAD
jgi:hypothetical protein